MKQTILLLITLLLFSVLFAQKHQPGIVKVKLPEDLKELLLVGDFDILIPSDDICYAAEEKQKREETGDACSKRDTIQTAPDLMKITR